MNRILKTSCQTALAALVFSATFLTFAPREVTAQVLGSGYNAVINSIKLAKTTNQIVTGASTNLTTLNFAASSGAVTLSMPNTTGNMGTVQYCGSTGVGNQTCSPAAAAATTKTYVGHSTLASNAAIITFPTAFASTTYDCVANDITTRANPVQMLSTSSATATITNTTGASDVVNWSCTGQ